MAPLPKLNLKKAGLSGLFLLGCVTFATAEQVRLQIESAMAEAEKRTGQIVVNIKIKPEPAFRQFTFANVGKPMRYVIGGRAVWEGIIREPIAGSSLQISGLTTEKAEQLAKEFSMAGTVEVELIDLTMQYSPAQGPLSPDASKH